MNFLTAGITLLAISVLVVSVFYSAGLMLKKLEISQIARRYILVMETEGCLTEEVQRQMTAELEAIGLSQIDLTGTTLQPVGYGGTIVLKIGGKVQTGGLKAGEEMWNVGFGTQEYYVEELRVSTAKN